MEQRNQINTYIFVDAHRHVIVSSLARQWWNPGPSKSPVGDIYRTKRTSNGQMKMIISIVIGITNDLHPTID